jgi:multiple sugar transport system permease protein
MAVPVQARPSLASTFVGRAARRVRGDSPSWTLAAYGLAGLYALLLLVPIYFVFIAAFKDNTQIFTAPLALPTHWTLTNLIDALESAKLLRALGISVTITACAEAVTIALAFPAAYAVARLRTRLAPLTEALFSLGFLIPALAILMPVFLTAVQLNLLYNPLMLIIFYPATKLSLAILLLSSQLRDIPRELEESAEIDGASLLDILMRIFLPLARPALLTVVLLNFIDIWNEYLFALVLLNSKNRTVQVAVATLRGERVVDYGLIAAGVLISLVPVLLVFLFSQERIMSGLYTGAVKE